MPQPVHTAYRFRKSTGVTLYNFIICIWEIIEICKRKQESGIATLLFYLLKKIISAEDLTAGAGSRC